MIRGRTGHMSVKTGKRVVVHLNSGEKIIAKFKEKKSRYVTFFDYKDILQNEIRTLSIYKGES